MTLTINQPAPHPPSNGHAGRQEIYDALLSGPFTQGYSPSPSTLTTSGEWVPQIYLFRDIELMLTHQIVKAALAYFKGGISGAQFWGGPDPAAPDSADGLPISDDEEVSSFVIQQCHRFWDHGVPKVQGGYDYGWLGAENLYCESSQKLCWWGLKDFHPRDCFLLTQADVPVGVRVKNVKSAYNPRSTSGSVDLWLASQDVPAKGLWYAHLPRFSNHSGTSQVLAAWKPWRRLAYKDGAETQLDTGFYRFAFCGPTVYYPEEDSAPANAAPATSLDSQGRPRRYARDVARQICEWAKAGAGFGLPSSMYPPEMGGGRKWELDWPEHEFSGQGELAYIKYLSDQICYGVGAPPELLQATETGSGYSGREITVEGFLTVQQRIADAMLFLFVEQVLRPLVRWNFGPEAQFRCQVRPLIESKKRAGQQPASGAQTGMPQDQSNPGWPRSPDQVGGNADMNPATGGSVFPPEVQTGSGWRQFTSPEGRQGWRSQGGQVRYQSQRPGFTFSLDPGVVTERVLAISQAILQARGAA